MAVIFARVGGAELENSPGFRADHYCGLLDRIALWAQGGRVRIFGCDGIVGRTIYSLVRKWNSSFFPGYSVDCEPPARLRGSGRRSRLRNTILFWPIVASFGSAYVGEYSPSRCLPWSTFVRYRAARVLPGSPSRTESVFLGQERRTRFGLTTNERTHAPAHENRVCDRREIYPHTLK